MRRWFIPMLLLSVLMTIGCDSTEVYDDLSHRDFHTEVNLEIPKSEIIQAVINGKSVPANRVTLPPVILGEPIWYRHHLNTERWKHHYALKFHLRSDNTPLSFVVRITSENYKFDTCDWFRFERDISLETDQWQEIILPLTGFYGNLSRSPYVVNQFDPNRITGCYLALEQETETPGEFSYEMGPVTVFKLRNRFAFFSFPGGRF